MTATNRMLINYVPGVECRVAVVREGRLEELHAERMDAASHVGNIYVGRVTNVEPAIQAAFVDFGLEANGFLHITDVHPKYFPGEEDDATERVGRKTPRSERPPIQACVKRGQEVIVQVLKEGIGTKGPTLTSYLSIPGRFLVMMPQMDKVGVSRRVEDEEQRREMREILDQLDLPEGFGFILRTAGMDQTKAELKRDLAYLQRLWKDMQRRMASGSKPRLLYAESDLLVRCLRDVLTADTEEVVVDETAALRRAASFLKIVAPRTGPRLLRYADACPIFHRFGIEGQIRMVGQRETPLPSGGSLVIDETEAMVAIDVNSGKMRDNRDAETTAFKTNMEAADEIARQLRLRDLGGVVMNDFIDMRSKKHQRELMERFEGNLKRDRAHTKALPPSAFGVVEMTRQRMRGSYRTTHTAECPHCRGLGRIPRPSHTLADGMRELAWLLHFEKVMKVEVVLPPRLAGELLSNGRQRLTRMERQTGKHVEVRVSETAPLDRVNFYAYDAQGADIDLERLVTPRPPEDLEVWHAPSGEAADWALDPGEEAHGIVRHEAEIEAEASRLAEEAASADLPLEETGEAEPEEAEWGALDTPAKRGRRRRGRGGQAAPIAQPARPIQPKQQPAALPQGEDQPAGGKRRRRRRRRGRGGAVEGQPMAPGGTPGPNRAESWDIEPLPGGGAASPGDAPSRADSWDVDPAPAARKARPPQPRPAAPSRASSWDIEPGEMVAATDAGSGPVPGPDDGQTAAGEGGAKRRRRRRRRRGGRGGAGAEGGLPQAGAAPATSTNEPGRADSWDLEPAQLPPVPPRTAPVSAPAPSRADSWDLEPPAAQAAAQRAAASPAARVTSAEPEAKPVVVSLAAHGRGDSWDVEPQVVTPAETTDAAPAVVAGEIAGLAAPVRPKRGPGSRGGKGGRPKPQPPVEGA